VAVDESVREAENVAPWRDHGRQAYSRVAPRYERDFRL